MILVIRGSFILFCLFLFLFLFVYFSFRNVGVWVQIEHYFSDSSLPDDSFLLKKIEEGDDDCILFIN